MIQNIVTPADDSEDITPEERQKQIDEVKQYVEEMRKDNAKVADIMSNLISEIEVDENKYKGQSILNIVENMKRDCIDRVISDFCFTWYLELGYPISLDDRYITSLKNIEEFELNNNIISNRVDFDSWIDSSYLEKAVQEYQGTAQ